MHRKEVEELEKEIREVWARKPIPDWVFQLLVFLVFLTIIIGLLVK